MAVDKLLVVNGTNWTSSVLTPFKIGRNKLWGEDTGRVMSGKMVGTLLGIFPKLEVQIYPRDEFELSLLIKDLDKAWQTIEYYDPKTRSLVSLGTYTNDYTIELLSLDNHYSAVTVSFISTEAE